MVILRKEMEVSSQGRGINDPWIWATVWGLTVGVGGCRARTPMGKVETTVIERQ